VAAGDSPRTGEGLSGGGHPHPPRCARHPLPLAHLDAPIL